MKQLLVIGIILFMLGVAASEVIDAFGQVQSARHETLAQY